eukprot:581493-Hanusia_phi.AAC.3
MRNERQVTVGGVRKSLHQTTSEWLKSIFKGQQVRKHLWRLQLLISSQAIDKCSGFDCGCSCNSSLLHDHGLQAFSQQLLWSRRADRARCQAISRSAGRAEEVDPCSNSQPLICFFPVGALVPPLSLQVIAATFFSSFLVCLAGLLQGRQSEARGEGRMCEVPAQGANMVAMRYQ